MLQLSDGLHANRRVVGAALLLGPALIAISSWMDLLFPEIEAVLAVTGYAALIIALLGLSQSWAQEAVPADAKVGRPTFSLAQLSTSLRRYGLLLTIATVALTVNALVIVAYSSSSHVTPQNLLRVLEMMACPNFWAALFINCLALLGWADLARPDR